MADIDPNDVMKCFPRAMARGLCYMDEAKKAVPRRPKRPRPLTMSEVRRIKKNLGEITGYSLGSTEAADRAKHALYEMESIMERMESHRIDPFDEENWMNNKEAYNSLVSIDVQMHDAIYSELASCLTKKAMG